MEVLFTPHAQRLNQPSVHSRLEQLLVVLVHDSAPPTARFLRPARRNPTDWARRSWRALSVDLEFTVAVGGRRRFETFHALQPSRRGTTPLTARRRGSRAAGTPVLPRCSVPPPSPPPGESSPQNGWAVQTANSKLGWPPHGHHAGRKTLPGVVCTLAS